jgi:hypothetical protein
MGIKLPDMLEVEIEAIDNQFYKWLDEDCPADERTDWAETWDNARHVPFTYTADEIVEGWGDDIEGFIETNDLAVDKSLHEEIVRKRKLIVQINEWYYCPHCEDGSCTSQEDGNLE